MEALVGFFVVSGDPKLFWSLSDSSIGKGPISL